MAKSGKISNGLVTLSSAAILAIYAAGYERTSPAAAKFAVQQIPSRGATAIPGVAGVERPSEHAFEVGTTPGVRSAPMRRQKEAVRSEVSSTAAIVAELPAQPLTPAPLQTTSYTAAPDTPEAATDVPVLNDAPAQPQPQTLLRDGTFTGWGYSRHGDIQASVVIQDGRIVSAEIAQCLTRYSCSWIAHLPGQVVSRQSPEVDYVSGATQSTDAYYGAVLEALNKAK